MMMNLYKVSNLRITSIIHTIDEILPCYKLDRIKESELSEFTGVRWPSKIESIWEVKYSLEHAGYYDIKYEYSTIIDMNYSFYTKELIFIHNVIKKIIRDNSINKILDGSL